MIKKFKETGMRPDVYRNYVRVSPGTELEKAYALASLFPVHKPKLSVNQDKIRFTLG